MLSGKGVIAGSYTVLASLADVFRRARFSSKRAPLKTPAWEANTVHAHMHASGLDQFPADVHVVSTYAAPQPPVGVLFPSVKWSDLSEIGPKMWNLLSGGKNRIDSRFHAHIVFTHFIYFIFTINLVSLRSFSRRSC